MAKRYVPRVGARLSEAQAQFIGEILSKNGEGAAKALLRASRAKGSPTHKLFDWSDKVAAEKWRLHRAQNLLSWIVVVTAEDEEGEVTKTERAFIRYRVDDGQGKLRAVYSPPRDAMRDPGAREQILVEVERRLRAAQLFAGEIEEIAVAIGVPLAKVREMRREKRKSA